MPQVVESHCEIDFSLEIETITMNRLIEALLFLVDKRLQGTSHLFTSRR